MLAKPNAAADESALRPYGVVTVVNTGAERTGRDLGNAWIWLVALGAPMFAAVLIDRRDTAMQCPTAWG